MTLQESAPSRRPRRDRCPHSTPHAGGRQGPERCPTRRVSSTARPSPGWPRQWPSPTRRNPLPSERPLPDEVSAEAVGFDAGGGGTNWRRRPRTARPSPQPWWQVSAPRSDRRILSGCQRHRARPIDLRPSPALLCRAARSHPAHGRWARPTARPAPGGAPWTTRPPASACSGKSKGVTVCTILATTSCAAPGSRRADPAGNHTRGQDDETGGDGRPVARPRAVPRCSLVLGTRGPPPEGCDPSAREHPSARRSQAPAARWSRGAQNAFQRARGERRGPFGEGPDLLEELAHGDEIGRVSFVATGEKLFDSGVVQGLVHPVAVLAPTAHRSAARQTEQRRRWTSPRR
jgi:hypothetical protein